MKKRILAILLTLSILASMMATAVSAEEIITVEAQEEVSANTSPLMTMSAMNEVKLNDIEYGTLVAALSDATDEDVITLIDDVYLSSSASIDDDITLDLNGYTISSATNITLNLNATVTIQDSSEGSTGKITSSSSVNQYTLLIYADGVLNFTGGMIVSNYVAMQLSSTAGDSSMSGDAAIDALATVIDKSDDYGFYMNGGYIDYYYGGNLGILDGYYIFAIAETDGVFAGLMPIYAIEPVASVSDDSTEYTSIIDAVEASAYGDTVTLTATTAISQPLTLRTGTTFAVENDAKLYLSENTSLMNCSNSDVTVYYDGDAYTVKAGKLFTAKTLGTPTEVDTEAELITALQADKPYIVMTDDITIYSNSLSEAYVTAYYSGTLDGGNNTLTLSSGTEDSGFYLVYYPQDGMVFQNLNVKLESQPSSLSCYISSTSYRVVFDNITILDSGEVFAIGNNWSPFIGHSFGQFIMKDCVNEQNFTGTGYQGLFIGGYTWAGATTAFVNCGNNGSLIGEDVAFFLGNPYYVADKNNDIAVTDIYVTGFVNNGVLRGSDTASIFGSNGGSTRLDYLNVLVADEWAYKNSGTVEVAEAYDFSGTIDASTGVISISDGTETAASYGVKMWGYAAIENGGGTSSTFAIMKADSVAEFNGAEMIFGTIIDDITFASEHPGVETYTAPWGENVFTQQPYEIAVINGTIYYVFDINDNCALNNTSPRVDIYAYDKDGYVIGNTTLSSTGVSPTVSSIDMIINDVAFLGTFAEAVTAAADGDTITLLTDVVASETATVSGKAITLDLNGNDLTFREGYGIANSGTLSIKDSVGGGVLDGTITSTGTIAISSGLFKATLESTWADTGYEVTTEGAYNTVQPAATVEYSALGNTIYGKLDGVTVGKLSILAPEDLVYTNSAKEAYIYDENSGVLGSQTIIYNTTDGNAPTEAGTYTASITATVGDENYTASTTFAISRVSVSFTVTDASFEVGHYVAPTYTPSVDGFMGYTVKYYDADGNQVDLDNDTVAGTYIISITVTDSNHKLSGTVGSVVVYDAEPETFDLTFVEDGDLEMTDVTDVIATTVHTLPTPSKYGYTFAGWTYNGKIYTTGAQFVQPKADVTMTGTWIEDKMMVSGTVINNDDDVIYNATVTLENVSGTVKTTTTTESGGYSFSDVAPGTYTLSVIKDGVTSSQTITVVTDDVTIDFKMTEISTKTTVVVEEGLTETSVSNLDAVTSAVLGDTDAESSVEVKLAVSSVEDSVAETAVTDAVGASEEIGHMVDISINQITDNVEIAPVSETNDLISITIALPADIQGMATYKVYRYHVDEDGVGEVDVLTTSKNDAGEYIQLVKTAGMDEEGNSVDVTTSIIIHAKYFSTYAVTSSDVEENTATSSGSTNTGTIVYPDAATTTTTTTEDDDDTSNTSATVAGMDDVYEGEYYADAVEWAVDNGITTGTTGSTFSPDEAGTRAHVLAFLYRAFGEPETDGENIFDDVDPDSYYGDAVNWGIAMGITDGIGDGLFGTDNTCTRAHIITFMWRAAGSPESEGTHDFSDVEEGSYYEQALLWATENGITNGMGDGTFGVDQPCTRAQIVTLLYRYFG